MLHTAASIGLGVVAGQLLRAGVNYLVHRDGRAALDHAARAHASAAPPTLEAYAEVAELPDNTDY